jgi:hypothetical protein
VGGIAFSKKLAGRFTTKETHGIFDSGNDGRRGGADAEE